MKTRPIGKIHPKTPRFATTALVLTTLLILVNCKNKKTTTESSELEVSLLARDTESARMARTISGGGDPGCWFGDAHQANILLRSVNLQHSPNRTVDDFAEIARLAQLEFAEPGIWITQETVTTGQSSVKNCESDPFGINPIYCLEQRINAAFGITDVSSYKHNHDEYDNAYFGHRYGADFKTYLLDSRILRIRLSDLRNGFRKMRIYNIHGYHQCEVSAAKHRRAEAESVVHDLTEFSPNGQELPAIFAGDFNIVLDPNEPPCKDREGRPQPEVARIDAETIEYLRQHFTLMSKPSWDAQKSSRCGLGLIRIDDVWVARKDRFHFNGDIEPVYLKATGMSPDTEYCRRRKSNCSPGNSPNIPCINCLTDHPLVTIAFKATCQRTCGTECGVGDGCGGTCSCDQGFLCNHGTCCKPDCPPNYCGPDGCGGNCDNCVVRCPKPGDVLCECDNVAACMSPSSCRRVCGR